MYLDFITKINWFGNNDIYTIEMIYNILQSEASYWIQIMRTWTIDSKINDTPKGVYLPILKLHSILAVVNLLAHNNKSQICYCGQISLQSAADNWSFYDTFGGNIYFAGDGTFIIVMRNYIHSINSKTIINVWRKMLCMKYCFWNSVHSKFFYFVHFTCK